MLIMVVTIFETTHEIDKKEISCEFITSYDYNSKTAEKQCYMFTTAIDSPDTIIRTRDNTMETLAMEHNKKIVYLPDKIGDAYPNLIRIRAANCSIKEISSTNLRNLAELKELFLQNNQIEKVASGAFEGMVELEVLNLGDNQMKEVANGAFKSLTKLKNLYLHGNQIEKIASGAFEGTNMMEYISFGKNYEFNISKVPVLFFFQNKIESNI
jgi:predicted nuclease of predicted toxin-antitoxin system